HIYTSECSTRIFVGLCHKYSSCHRRWRHRIANSVIEFKKRPITIPGGAPIWTWKCLLEWPYC
ncbi:hypothetical protein BJV78DRAFT_1348630, partial [Lactifluus subvellereus]